MKILALLQLPPPVHGASRMNRLSLDVLKEEYPHTKAINIGLANDASDVNSLSISKLLKFIKLLGSVWLYSFKVRPDQIYASISPTGGAFIKDFMFLFVAKLMKIPIKFHIHGNGISNFYNKKVYRKLYNFLLEGETLIVLSPELKKNILV
ncbi:hypothetical protein [Psychrosphaera haliotis]|uniref:Glycosyltransferase n=1 Tax=Psychrosphaera haliotis TaxID=555083 RepID=A0A6N8F4Y9_9GAMM|nr:hypothetical protein [Psychrosphaera haliotis]MUH71343.1 hypothetical protein [Psychrosphaera haliotis]